ncbi:NADP-dependent oxidoreductase [Amycolatopsis acidicola]|uniref:NADP-dependent oxidoreductase n=1 Tax=Amycolatopsis acidicola TaxID=2596893 RepID=A0A5N0V627_9PSEU|nr:NADP-dependent oxidoreductase [Amycolatopsis acidicola]KAA9160888.1 NADP-dependent oxidoreductase [Amycolatopsis acidicola]
MENRRFVLASRPDGLPRPENFRLESGPVPTPADGQILVRNVYLGVDPGLRPALADAHTGDEVDDEFEPIPLGELVGYFDAGIVERSRHPGFAPGDWVTGMLKWQEYGVLDGAAARKLPPELPPSTGLGVLGIPGLSAYFGLLELGAAQKGETVLVTSAAGTVGSIAGQIAALRGCRVLGTAGTDEKCRRLREEFGFAAAVNYRTEKNLAAAIRLAAPEGVDVLFDNVGTRMVSDILPLMRPFGRIVACGQIADYGVPPEQLPGLRNTNRFITHRLTLRGLFVHDFAESFPRALAELSEWAGAGLLRCHEDIETGFERLPAAFAQLFTGENAGRKLVKIDERDRDGH